MAIEFQKIDQVKTVSKPWGYEKWIQPGSDQYPYVLKLLCLKSGNKTSLQVHQYKTESIYILEGSGLIMTVDDYFDCSKYLDNQYSEQKLSDLFNQMRAIQLNPGDVFHTPPGTIHRMIAHTDLKYIESSTTELDDVIRLQDDNNRLHGRIDAEHI